jgi:hypothetical protein
LQLDPQKTYLLWHHILGQDSIVQICVERTPNPNDSAWIDFGNRLASQCYEECRNREKEDYEEFYDYDDETYLDDGFEDLRSMCHDAGIDFDLDDYLPDRD